MISERDRTNQIELRDSELSDQLARKTPLHSVAGQSLLARTVAISMYPTSGQCFFACQPVALLGTESEGAQGVISTRSGSFFAFNLGSSSPPVGTLILATFADSRWVFYYDS